MEQKYIDEILQQIDAAAELYREQLELNGVNATGALSTFTTEYEYNDNHFVLYFNLEDYWKYVEYGRSAGSWPPIDAIRQWIIVKPVTPVPSVSGKIPTTDQLAFLISRKIATEGIAPRHPLTKAMLSPDMDPIVDAIKSALVESIREELVTNINEILT